MRQTGPSALPDWFAPAARFLAWSLLWLTIAYLINVWLAFGASWPGAAALFADDGAPPLAVLQAALFPAALLLAAAQIWRAPGEPPAQDARRLSDANAFFIRGCFWSVALLGAVDGAIAVLRLEGGLPLLLGSDLAEALGKKENRALLVHLPLTVLGFAIAARRKTLDFPWLALFVVAVELVIVIGRAFFTYEQTYATDLARFWYSALFLLGSAHTLLTGGHVRVDVIYAGLSKRGKGWVDAVGALLLGIVSVWTILILGTLRPASPIVGPILDVEIWSTYGAHVKYVLAALLGVFAVSMTVQFLAQFLQAVEHILSPASDAPDAPDAAPPPVA